MSNGNGKSDNSWVVKDSIIDNIEIARTQNNMNWMSILQIAMRHAPIETCEALRRISKTDHIISALTKELIKNDRQ